MAAVVLAPCQLAVEKAGEYRRHGLLAVVIGQAEVLGAEQLEHLACGYGSLPAAVLVQPQGITLLRNAVADEHKAGSAQRDEFVRVYRQHVGVPGSRLRLGCAVLDIVACHPVILTGVGEILQALTEQTAVQGSSTLAGRSDKSHVETIFECKGHKSGFAIS